MRVVVAHMVGKTFADSSPLCIRKQSLSAFVAALVVRPSSFALARENSSSCIQCSMFVRDKIIPLIDDR